MVRYLGPAPSVDVILDQLGSFYGPVSTFGVMMQGFYRESQGRNESVAHYVTRLQSKLNDIHVKHPNRVSKKERAGYIRDHPFYGLRKHLWEAIHTKFEQR